MAQLPLFPDDGGPIVGSVERWAKAQGYFYPIAGIDEAGRGPLAGPVVAACVVLPEAPLAGLDDSKRLSARRRHQLEARILEVAVASAVASASPSEIDEINILQATRLAMARALKEVLDTLAQPPSLIVIDGNVRIAAPVEVWPVVKGDQKSVNVAAASILAKEHRDRIMVALDGEFPGYGFAQHKGYPTVAHRRALAELGPTPSHRRSFRWQ